LRDAGIPIGRFITLHASSPVPSFDEAVRGDGTTPGLGCPLFVKPANLGSSVGVAKIHNEAEYHEKVAAAFQFDRKVILEEFIEGREIECGILGNDAPEASVPGEILVDKGGKTAGKAAYEFYSYEAKYIDENGATLSIPARLDAAAVKRVQDLAIRTFKALDCAGLARVDSFLRPNGEVVVNEINTLPGFTRISMYPKLWEASGVPYPALITRLITLAIERYNAEKGLKTSL
jgi:D-alanine-D-alanine ligase